MWRCVLCVVLCCGACWVDVQAATDHRPLQSLPSAELLALLRQAPDDVPIVVENAHYRIDFDASGALQGVFDKRSSVVRDIERLRGSQFQLNTRKDDGTWHEQALNEMVLLEDGRSFLVGDTARQIAFRFEYVWTEHSLRFDLKQVSAPESVTLGNLYFDFYIEGSAKIVPLDYMTKVKPHGVRYRAEFPWLWGIREGGPIGSFALILAADAVAEDEALLHLWVEGGLPHPKIEGEWTVARPVPGWRIGKRASRTRAR